MLTVTEKAAAELKKLMAEKDENGRDYNPDTVGLRVFVQGGGCSGFQYGMKVEHEAGIEDFTSESNGVRIYVDPISAQYVRGAEVDFVDNLMGGGFTVNNPNAKSTCGCGQSFQADPEK